jgi:hypothetical protein
VICVQVLEFNKKSNRKVNEALFDKKHNSKPMAQEKVINTMGNLKV